MQPRSSHTEFHIGFVFEPPLHSSGGGYVDDLRNASLLYRFAPVCLPLSRHEP